jgi:PAS domain-containing protein
MLYHSQTQQKLIGKRGSAEVQNAILAITDEGSYFAKDDGGKERLYGFVRINIEKDSPYMYIVVSTPLSQAFSDANRVFYRNIALTILAIFFSIFIFIYYRNFIFRNIEKLVEIAHKLKDGDLAARTNMDYSAGETGTLAQAFDKMAESLLARENEKDSINKNLRILTERLEIAVISAHIGIWEWDLITQKVYWNSQMYELYHRNESNFKGTIPDWMKFLHPEDAAQFEEELHHSIRYKKNHKTSFRIKTPHKGYKTIRCYFTIICDLKGKPLHITGINIDYTERVFLENELAHTKGLLTAKTNELKTSLNNTIIEIDSDFKKVFKQVENIEFTPETNKALKNQLLIWQNSIRKELEEIITKI